jgi:transcription antitermination factor NusG
LRLIASRTLTGTTPVGIQKVRLNIENPVPNRDVAADGKEPNSDPLVDRRWFAVFTIPQNEKSVVRHLEMREVESFLPTYEVIKVWKNRQRVKTVLPLFPRYLFVHIHGRERVSVLESPGVLQIVGNSRESAVVPDADIVLLQTGLQGRHAEPYRDLVVGERVRIRSGVMCGVEGTLVRRTGGDRFVLTMRMINQHASIQVDAEDLELLGPETGDAARAAGAMRNAAGQQHTNAAPLAGRAGSR